MITEPMHVTKLTHIASGATAYGSASRATVEDIKQTKAKKLLSMNIRI